LNTYNSKYEIVLKKTTLALVAFIFIDVVFLILHVFYSVHILDNKNFKTSYDGGYGEIFQYFKFISSSIILFYLARQFDSKLLLFWSFLAFFLFLDDWIRFHEIVGGKMLGGLMKSVVPGAYHQGQVVYGIIVALILCTIGWRFWKTSSESVRKLSINLFIALSLLWFSAVLIDYIHAIWVPKAYNLPCVLMEEGGEHLAASLFLWFCFVELVRIKQNSEAPSS